jgi:hypothetical protein
MEFVPAPELAAMGVVNALLELSSHMRLAILLAPPFAAPVGSVTVTSILCPVFPPAFPSPDVVGAKGFLNGVTKARELALYSLEPTALVLLHRKSYVFPMTRPELHTTSFAVESFAPVQEPDTCSLC